VDRNHLSLALAISLVIYLLIVGVGASVLIAANFPEQKDTHIAFPQGGRMHVLPLGEPASIAQGLIWLAMLAGVAGSFLHAAQSLSSYIGNGTFKSSWAAWYFLRPWIGAVLGFAIYFALRTGLVGGVDSVNPYGVVAIGFLGGWFSKTTTDKLQEVFETLFKTDADKERKDKLKPLRPVIDAVVPTPVPAAQQEIAVRGSNFQEGAQVVIEHTPLATIFVSNVELRGSLAGFARPAAGTQRDVFVKNPKGDDPVSAPHPTTFSG